MRDQPRSSISNWISDLLSLTKEPMNKASGMAKKVGKKSGEAEVYIYITICLVCLEVILMILVYLSSLMGVNETTEIFKSIAAILFALWALITVLGIIYIFICLVFLPLKTVEKMSEIIKKR